MAKSKISCALNYRLLQSLACCFLFCCRAAGQDSAAFQFSGYSEIYYSFDFDNPANHEKPFFLYNHKRHNEVSLNLAFAKASYTTPKLRSNLAFMAGTYPQYNLAAEPEIFRFVYEANIGIRLSRNRNIWLDAGIMPSHIGFESAVAADCWTPSRSIVAENSPYYETGIKLTSTNKKENFIFAFLLLNGWQRVQRPPGINTPAFGLLLNYKPNADVTLNYSNFLGTDKPDTAQAFRIYHNLFVTGQLSRKWGLIAGFDIGRDKTEENKYAVWYTPAVIVRRSIGDNAFVALRSEYFRDGKQVLVKTNTAHGFEVFGVSLNYDYAITKNALTRIEWKSYCSKDKIFNQNNARNNHALLLTMSIKL